MEQGPRLRGCVRGAECRRTATKSNPGAPPGSDPHTWAPLPPYGAPRWRGCAPDPVREALVREGAREAANDVHETGRMRLLPQTGLRLTGRSRTREAGCRRTATDAGLTHTYAVASPEGSLLRAPVRTPREDL